MNEIIRSRFISNKIGEVVSTSPDIFKTSSPDYYRDKIRNFKYNKELMVYSVSKSHYAPDAVKHVNNPKDNFLIRYTIQGEGSINGYPLGRGRGYCAWPGDPRSHIVSSKESPLCFIWLTVSGSEIINLLRQAGITHNSKYFSFEGSSAIEALTDRLIYEEQSFENIDMHFESILKFIFSYHIITGEAPANNTVGESKFIDDVLSIIEKNLLNGIKIQDIADMMYISRKSLHRIFREQTGCSPQSYLIKRKMELAGDMLKHSDIPVKEVSAIVGYSDHTQFFKIFKKYTGVSPSQFRRK